MGHRSSTRGRDACPSLKVVSYSSYNYDSGGLVAKEKTYLFQARISEEEKRRIKALAASQGMTLQKALTAAFTAWAKELKAGGAKTSGEPKKAGRK